MLKRRIKFLVFFVFVVSAPEYGYCAGDDPLRAVAAACRAEDDRGRRDPKRRYSL